MQASGSLRPAQARAGQLRPQCHINAERSLVFSASSGLCLMASHKFFFEVFFCSFAQLLWQVAATALGQIQIRFADRLAAIGIQKILHNSSKTACYKSFLKIFNRWVLVAIGWPIFQQIVARSLIYQAGEAIKNIAN
jgi:hypothetical protein